MAIPKHLFLPKVQEIAGESKAGKTFFCFHHPLALKGAVFIDIEHRHAETCKLLGLDYVEYPNPDKLQHLTKRLATDKITNEEFIAGFRTLMDAYTLHENKVTIVHPILSLLGKEKGVLSLQNLHSVMARLFAVEPRLVVLDGVTDLAKIARVAWHDNHPQRDKPSVYEWGDIYEDVRSVLKRFTLYARFNQAAACVTALMKDDYQDNEATGERIIAARDFVHAMVDEIGEIYRDGTDFLITYKGVSLNGTFNITKEDI